MDSVSRHFQYVMSPCPDPSITKFNKVPRSLSSAGIIRVLDEYLYTFSSTGQRKEKCGTAIGASSAYRVKVELQQDKTYRYSVRFINQVWVL